MPGILAERVAEAREIQGRILSGRDVFVGTTKFAQVCKLLWPDKTAAHLASIAGRDERSAKRWLAGEFEPPICVKIAIDLEIYGQYLRK